jgi:hypothetical protein
MDADGARNDIAPQMVSAASSGLPRGRAAFARGTASHH